MSQSFADYCRELTETVGKAYQENLRIQHEAMVMSEYNKIKDAMILAAKTMKREYVAYFGRDFSTADLEQIATWLRDEGLSDVSYEYHGESDNYSMTVRW